MQLFHSINLKQVIWVVALGIELINFMSPAYAVEGDVIRPYVSATYMYDDNLRRLSSSQQAVASTGHSNTADTVLMTGVGIILDKTVSRQHFYIDINVNKSKFSRNSELDNDGKEMKGQWYWQLGNHLNGKFDIYHKEALVPFSDFRGIGLNLRTETRQILDAIWTFHPRWRVRGAVAKSDIKFSADAQKAAGLEEVWQELGGDYVSQSGSSTGLIFKHIDGTRPAQVFLGVPISNDYAQNEAKLNINWLVTPKSGLQFLGGFVSRKHDQFSERDFSGFNARTNFNWLVTSKTNLNVSAWRENNAQSFVTTSYTLNKGVSLKADWEASAKVKMQAIVRRENREFVGDEVFGQARTDKDNNFSLALIYKPTLATQLNATFTHSKRDSTSQFFEFTSNSFALTGQYEF